MKLPDDKDPQIVWDADKKRWVDKTKPEGEEENLPPPPPAMKKPSGPPTTIPGAPAAASTPSSAPNAATAPPPMGSSFRMAKSRGARGRYVDVMKDSGSVSASPAPPMGGGMMPPLSAGMPPTSAPPPSAPAPVSTSEGEQGAPPMMFFDPSAMGGGVANPFPLPSAK